MGRVVVGMLAGGIGFALYAWSGWRSLGIGAALGSYALIDRMGWIPSPYQASISSLLHETDEGEPPSDRAP